MNDIQDEPLLRSTIIERKRIIKDKSELEVKEALDRFEVHIRIYKLRGTFFG